MVNNKHVLIDIAKLLKNLGEADKVFNHPQAIHVDKVLSIIAEATVEPEDNNDP